MKLHKISCPNCDGTLDMNVADKEFIFCPYCGQKFFIEDGKKEYTINRNTHVKKDINKNVTHRTINDAEIIKAKTVDREKKYEWLGWVLCFGILIGIVVFSVWMAGSEDRAAKKAMEAGKISAGSYKDYEGENFEAVVEQLEALGFTNISTVDLDDSGIALWKANKVESVSVGGETTFYSYDYFDSDVVIIVKYH